MYRDYFMFRSFQSANGEGLDTDDSALDAIV